MIENFLRRPQTLGEGAADAVRVIGALSVVVAAIWFDLTDAGVLAFALPGLMVPRFVGVRSWFDITCSVTLLVAAWSNVFDLYTSVAWWDLAVHLVCTGVAAALLYVLLARIHILPSQRSERFVPAGAVVVVTAFGLALSAVWEMVEWIGFTFISDDIFVAYGDTIADMAVGGVGALLAGFAVAHLTLLRD
ncbi:hypothetical protein [Microbacterium marmarense]|uniref:DUF2238 domain-containing protein n=1 Tax=Microbacterium marmarense TaxID=3122051 RepID=A0ABU8LRF5_9MICO